MFGPKRVAGAGGFNASSPLRSSAAPSARSARKAARKNRDGADFRDLNPVQLAERYGSSGLQFYDSPPNSNISLELMETLAVERLRFLRLMEKHASSKEATKFSKEWRQAIVSDAKGQGLEAYVNLFSKSSNVDSADQSVLENRSRDHFSHFILRLAYSRTEDLRRWFVSQETDVFKLKLMAASPQEISAFMALHDLSFTVVSQEEKEELKEDLHSSLKSSYQEGSSTPDQLTFYKVHFTEALDLVRKRNVLISNGQCYVPETEMTTLLAQKFKSLLTQNLAYTAKILPNLDEDERLIKMLTDLDRRYTGSMDEFNAENADVVTPEMIKPLSEKSFPLCMKSMQCALTDTHHLKYKARLQYGLFLKGIGLSMEDAIRYFRGEFVRGPVDPEKFDKEYTYGIRYNYGKEGKKVNWAPWNCMRIIMESVGPGENHGCPYKHHDHDVLKAALVKSGIEAGSDEMNQIITATKEGHFQKACSLQFSAAHRGQDLSTGIVNHPNQFYMESAHPGGVSRAASTPSQSKHQTHKAHLYLEKPSTQHSQQSEAEAES